MHIFNKNNDVGVEGTAEKKTKEVRDLSDDALIKAIADGALWAMDMIYERYSQVLYSLAYRVVHDHQVAEDLLQESFLSVWRNASSYSSSAGAVHSWLFSIIHHRAIDHLRKLQRRESLYALSLDEVDKDNNLASSDTWEQVWVLYQQGEVRRALMALSKEQRMVIELAYFQGWTHSEIAEGCHIPLGTVKARMRLGLLHLKKILEHRDIRGQ